MSDSIPASSFHGGKGLPLSRILAGSTTWERTIVPIGDDLRHLAWVVAPLSIGLVAGHIGLRNFVLPDVQPGFFIVGWPWTEALVEFARRLLPLQVASAVALTAICVLTAGFREAGRRVQLALGVSAAVAIACALAPVAALVIAAVNLALWVAIGALILAGVLAVLAALLDEL